MCMFNCSFKKNNFTVIQVKIVIKIAKLVHKQNNKIQHTCMYMI